MYNEQTIVSLTFAANTKKKEKSYWVNQLSGQPQKSSFPFDHDSKDSSAYRLEAIDFSLPDGIARKLIDLSKGSNVHLFIFLMTGAFILLRKYTGNKDILLGIPVSRTGENTTLINSALAIRCPFEDTFTFPQLLSKVQQILIEAGNHQNFPIQVLGDLLGMPWAPGEGFPLFDVVVSLRNIHQDTLHEFFPNILISFTNSPTGLEGRFSYNPGRYNADTITRLINHYQALLGAVLANPYKKMSEIELLSEEEKHRIMVSFNDTDVDVPDFITVHELIDRQAEVTPHAAAVVCKNQWLSYEELKNQTDSLAGVLRQKGLQSDQAAAVISGPSLEMVVSLIAILKAGGAYLPIDPEYPDDRINYMLKDSNAKILLAVEECRKKIIVNCQLLIVNCELLIGRPRRGLHHSNQLAYIIYTSGSTGKPKGVMIQHRSFVDFTLWAVEVFEHRPGYQVLLSNSFASDGAVQQIFPPLVSGGVLHLIEKELRLDIHHYLDYLKKNKINNIDEVPVLMNELLAQIDPDDGEEKLPDLTCLCLGSEYVPMELVRKCRRYLNRSGRIINAYGPAEASVEATFYPFDGTSDREISLIGKPRRNTRVYILDEAGNCCPIGVRGEICISGMGLARGYLNQPELTTEKFILNRSYKSNRTYILYKTGDQGCWLPDGNIRFFGRVDNQIKIRGYRVELSEIEKVLKNHEGIKDAVVLVREKVEGEMEVCAYYVEKPRVTLNPSADFQGRLLQYLGDRLPSYMIPAYCLALEKIPLTPNGKVDKNALPLPEPGTDPTGEYTPPRNDLEKKLVYVWSEILNRPPGTIGINTNFFKIGGHSLKAIILVSRIRKEFNMEFPLNSVFSGPTIREFAVFIENSKQSAYQAVNPVEKRSYYPQSSAQKRLFFLDHLESIGVSYNMPSVLRMTGKLDIVQFEKTVRAIIHRHESLRSSFHLVRNEPVQVVHDRVEFEIDNFDLTVKNVEGCEEDWGGPGRSSAKVAEKEIIMNFIQPFNLSRAPLIRMGIITLSETEHLLLYDMHHIIGDGTSSALVAADFIRLYAGEELPPLRIQYKDFSCWQNRLLQGSEIESQKQYWLNLYSDAAEIPKLNLATDYPRPAVFDFAGNHYRFVLGMEDTRVLRKAALDSGATLYMNLLAVFNLLLYKYTGQEDIIVGGVIAGRRHADLQDIVGMFVNTLAMRNRPHGDKTCREFLEEVKADSIKAFENQDVQFEELVENLNLVRDPSRNPLFDVCFVMQNVERFKTHRRQSESGEGLIFSAYEFDNKISQFDMALDAIEAGDEIEFRLEYCARLFNENTIRRFARHFVNIIRFYSRAPEGRLADVDWLSEEEKKQVLVDFNNTEADYPRGRTIHELFSEQVERSPDAAATAAADRCLTYRQLDRDSHQLAHYLVEAKQVCPEMRIGLMMDKSIEGAAAILGILKAGGAYVPLDPSLPEGRIKNIIEDAGIEVVITRGKYVRVLNRLQWECPSFHTFLCLDSTDMYSYDDSGWGQAVFELENQAKIWEYVGESASDEITGGGWISSYTGQPLSKAEMDEYGDNVLKKLTPLLHEKMRVLEIGCASGITMFRVAPKVGFYYGTDLSKVIIAKNKEKIKQEGHENITVSALAAHEIGSIHEQDFDLVIINSVIQDFPGHNYLRGVIRKAVDLLGDSGYLLVGDVMDRDLKADITAEMADFKLAHRDKNYKTKTDFSMDLFISRGFFEDLRVEIPHIREVNFSEKIYTIENELTKFRYDVLMRVDKKAGELRPTPVKHKYQHGASVLGAYSADSPKKITGYVHSGNLAYVLYTSGTTGKPRGVIVEHRSVVNLSYWFGRTYRVEKGGHLLQLTGYSFDPSVEDIFGTLLHGGVLHVAGDELIADRERFRRYVDRHGIHIIDFIPAILKELLGEGNRLKSLRTVISGGERLEESLKDCLLQRGYSLYNHYGPTEVTVDALVSECSESEVTLGTPIQGTSCFILDRNGGLVGVGVPGELCVSGTGVARGYLNQPELTAEKFIKSFGKSRNPFSKGFLAAGGIYCTGDLARWLPCGNIEFLGRIDQQVKIHGVRIEPGEIESRLRNYPGVKEAVVLARTNEQGEYYLCAYITPQFETEELRNYLSRFIPGYMIPSYFIFLEEFPLTVNGKIDRGALPGPERMDSEAFAPPTSGVEKKLAELWAEVLAVDKNLISSGANFFALGGHSLKATILVARINKAFHVEFPLSKVFSGPTVKEQAQFIEKSKRSIYEDIQPVEKKEYYPQSSAQKRLFFLDHFENIGTSYNMTALFNVEGKIDTKRFEEVLIMLIQRHEALRTSFRLVDNGPVQVIHDRVEFAIEYYELGAKGQGPENYIRPFDLSRAPLMRAILKKNEETEFLLIIDMHHIISDGASMGVLVKDFMSLYEGRELPQPRLYYKDYAEWQIHVQAGIRQQETFWLKELAGEIPVLNLPTDYLRPRVQSFAGSALSFNLDRNETRSLNALALRQNVTLYMVLFAAFAIFLAKMSNQEDIIIGTPTAGRRHADLEQIIGMFVNTLPLRNWPTGEKDFITFLEEERTRTISAFENQDYQYESLVEKIMPNRDVSRNPLFDVMFALQNTDLQAPATAIPGLKVVPYEVENKTTKFDLTLIGIESGEGLLLSFDYCTRLFKQETIERFIVYFKNIVRSIVKKPDQRICDLEILTEKERRRILLGFNDTVSAYPKDKTIPGLFAEQVDRNPDRIAVVGANRHPRVCPNCLTYRQLNEQSNRLAGLLIEKGILADNIVGIMMERSVEMIIGIMGILKSGGAYLPIDPVYPRDRVDYMLKDSGARILINKSEIRNPKLETNPDVQKINVQNKSFEDLMVLDFEHLNFDIVSNFVLRASNFNSSNLAYIIYTSGTTGKPKGVLIKHSSVINLIYHQERYFNIDKSDRILQFSTICFDASVEQIFVAICSGAASVLIDKNTLLDIEKFDKFVSRQQVTHIHAVPSFLSSIDSTNMVQLKRMIAGGDVCPVSLAKKWSKRCKFYNEYGPTETTITSVELLIEDNDTDISQSQLSIGKPVSNTRVYLLDRWMQSLPVGVIGELYIGGDGVARGYLNRPQLTAEAFVPDPFKVGEKCYKTGDLAKWRSNGNIEFLGRLDHQVKIRGYRIELGEIENRLLCQAGINGATVIARSDKNGHKYLCAYIISEREFTFSELRESLAKVLPDYMIPSYFVKIEKMPFTSNGKIDHNALPDPEEHEGIHLHRNADYMPPTSILEEKLVEIWENVLGVANIGVNDNFFALGGDSIKTIQIASRLNTAGYKLDIKDIMQYPEISLLAPLVKKQQRITEQREVTGRVPLTPIQRWFFEKVDIDPHHFNQAVMLYSREGFDKKILEVVFTRIQEHHDALRNTFHWNTDSGEIVQTGHGLDFPLFLKEFDLKDHENSLAEMNNKINEIQAGIDLENGPLMKLGLFHLDDGDRLLIVIHHLVTDGVSWRILFEDMETLYTQCIRGEKPALPPKTDSFKHWAEKLAIYADSKAFLLEKNYWNQLESNPVPRILRDLEGKDNFVKDTRNISFNLGEEETSLLLTKVNNAFRTEINDILLTMLGMGIRKTFAQDRVLIALEGHGREDILENIDISRTIGWFTGLFPVILDLYYVDDTSRQLKEIKETLRKIPHKGIGYGILRYLSQAENKKEIEFKLEPQISFNYLGQFDEDVNNLSFCEPAGEPVGNIQGADATREFEIDVSALISNNRLNVGVSYNETHFKPETMAAFLKNIQAELHHIIAYCSTRETMEYTPSDFTFKGLTIENLDRLMKEYQGIEDIYTLSPMQEGLLFQSLVDHSSYSYFEQVALRMEGELDIPLVGKSLNDLFKRHDILRTAFVWKNIDPSIQIVLKERAVNFHYQDISEMGDREERELFITKFKVHDKQRSFDLSKDVLMRVSVFLLDRMEYEFIWSFHHILMDGWCLGILNREFLNIYHGYVEKKEGRLPGVKPYRAYIQWLERLDKEESLHYWSNYLASYEEPVVIPKTTGMNKEAVVYRNEKVSVVLGKEKTAALNKLAAENRVTLNTMLQVVWGILLGKFNGKEDVVFGAVVSGRPYQLPGVESMVGLFINSIPMRVKFTGGQEFNRLVQIIQQESIAGEPYHYHPLADIQSRGPLKQSLFDHLFIFENYPIAEQIEGYRGDRNKFAGLSLKVTSVDVFDQTHYDFNIILSASDQINITFQYNGSVVDSNFVQHLAERFRLAIDRIIENKETKIGELISPSPEEMNRILYEFNNTEVEFPENKTIHELFTEQAERTPDRIALVVANRHLRVCPNCMTYRELNDQSDRLAGLLIEKGVLADNIVGVMMERSVEMMVGIYGILKAGGAYLPIDPEYPRERIDYMLKDSGAKIMIERAEFTFSCFFPASPLPRFLASDSSNLAYIIYTSGSTGRPKGVMMQHRAVVNRLNWMQRAYPINENDVLIQKTPVTFDVSVWELFWWSFYGSSLFLPAPGVEKDPKALVQAIEMHRVTTVHFVPSMLNVWLDYIDNTSAFKRLMSLRQVFSSGEALEVYQVVKFNNGIGKVNHTRLVNLYGPTEACVDVSYFNCRATSGQNLERVPIGKPIDNIRLYVVSDESVLQPVGIAGELLIAGVGLARGYLNRPELTNQKFLEVQEPFFKKVPGLFYKTADLARWLPDGNVEFLGRIDHQVKVRGFRIELGEIEARLMDHPWVKEAVVIPRQDKDGDKKLCAYVVLDVAGSAQVGLAQSIVGNELRTHLLKHLPEYMVPPYLMIMDKMPLSANGKLDRRALPEPEINAGGEYVGPRDEAEKGIVFIVADILGMDPAKISVRANFFNMGLNSISILKLAQRISEEFRIDFPIGTLFTSPSVEGVVADMKKGYHPGASRRAVLLNRKRAAKNLFLISGDGRVYIFKELALLLEGHFNVYGVQGKGFMDTGPLPQTRREVFADLLREIKLVQPEGPYLLGGHCYGAIISYELARILEERKEAVAKIVLLDEPALMTDDIMDRLVLLRWFNKYRNTVETLERIVKSIETKLREKGHTDREKMPTVKSGSMPEDLEARRIEINKNYNRLFPNPLHYTRIINSPLLVFKTDQSAFGPAPEPRWNPATIARTSRKSVEVVDTAGDHLSMFAAPHVAVLAKQCIERI